MFSCILLLLCLVPSVALAECTCSTPTLAASFKNSDVVVKAHVTGRRDSAKGFRYYDARILSVYKGCNVTQNQTVVIATPWSVNSCRVFMDLTTPHLFMGHSQQVNVSSSIKGVKPITQISISRCQFQARYNTLNTSQVQHLKQLQSTVPACGKAVRVCNATSCGTKRVPKIPPCPGQSTTLDRARCVYQSSTGECGYVILPCPSAAPTHPPTYKCSYASCGAIPPIVPCPHGNGPSYSCVYNQQRKACSWLVSGCN